MRIVQLTEQEAANVAVMKNVAEYLLTGEPAHLQTLDVPVERVVKVVSKPDPIKPAIVTLAPTAPIGIDAPDVGTPTLEVPVASPFAHLGFGQSPVPPALSTAAAVPLPTAPATSTPTASVPLPPAVPTVPLAAVPPVPATSGAMAGILSHAGIVTDKNGLIWDERIHSSSKQRNADDTWRKKRGVADDLVVQVEAEIRKVLAIPMPVSAPPVATAVAAVPAVPLPPTAPVAPPAADGQAFTRWIEELSPDMQPGGRFTPELMSKLLVAQGLDPQIGLMAFTMREDLVPAARDMLNVWMTDPSQVPQ